MYSAEGGSASKAVQQLVGEVLNWGAHASKEQLLAKLEQAELKIADMVQINPRIVAARTSNLLERLEVQPQRAVKSPTLIIPKGDSLTDSLLRTTLGCQEKLAKEYLDICKKHDEGEKRQASIADIKKKFTDSNSFKDFYANTKAHSVQPKQQPKPLIDNEHQDYMKTQLMFLEKPKTLNEQISHHNKKFRSVVSKIDELGGIEDTLKSTSISKADMEYTLKANEIEEVRRHQTYEVAGSPTAHQRMRNSQHFNTGAAVVFDGISKSRKMRGELQQAQRRFFRR